MWQLPVCIYKIEKIALNNDTENRIRSKCDL